MPSNQSDMFSQVEAMRQRSAEREAERLEMQRQKAAENRRRMPEVTRFVDSMRAIFPDAKVTYAQEGGVTMGQPSQAGVSLAETSIRGSFARGRK